MLGYSILKTGNKETFRRKPPCNLAEQHRHHFEINASYTCPDLKIYKFSKAFLLPDSTLFIHGFLPLSSSFPYFRGRIRHHSVKGIIDIRRNWKRHDFQKRENPYLVVHDQWTQNYYHWITQALPRLKQAMEVVDKFILLLPAHHRTEFHTRSLKLLGVEEVLYFETDHTYYEVHNLLYPAHDIQVGDYQDNEIRALANALTGKIDWIKGERKIFIQRNGPTRRIENEVKVLKLFTEYGFDVMDFSSLCFEEQIKTALGASVLAGVHGAGLTNMIFMMPGSRVLELTTRLKGDQYYYYTLSNAMGHHYYYQHCASNSSQSIQEANLWVDTIQLKETLKKILDDAG